MMETGSCRLNPLSFVQTTSLRVIHVIMEARNGDINYSLWYWADVVLSNRHPSNLSYLLTIHYNNSRPTSQRTISLYVLSSDTEHYRKYNKRTIRNNRCPHWHSMRPSVSLRKVSGADNKVGLTMALVQCAVGACRAWFAGAAACK